MNSLPSFYTTNLTCMHSIYIPPLWHALSYVYQFSANELHYSKLYIKKIKHSVNSKYLLQCGNNSSRTKNPKTQFYSSFLCPNHREISNRMRNLKLIILTEVTCCHLRFVHSSKLQFFSNFPSFRWRIAFTFGFNGVAWLLSGAWKCNNFARPV
jgi:hypothetical protein